MLGSIPVAILILLAVPLPGASVEDSLHLHLAPDTGFADYLYSAGLWDRAATEYLRTIHGSEGDTLSLPMPSLRLARCWHELGDHRASLDMFSFLADGLSDPDLRACAMMGAGSVLETDGDFASARILYLSASSEASDPDIRDRSRILAALSAGSSGDWSRAESELKGVATMDGPGSELAASIAMIAGDGDHLPRRSPFWCAAASALLPGSGQVISGNTSDGLVALGTNLLLGYLFVTSLEEDDTATSVLFGWLSISFYGANVYGGARAANGYNITRRAEFLDRLELILERSN